VALQSAQLLSHVPWKGSRFPNRGAWTVPFSLLFFFSICLRRPSTVINLGNGQSPGISERYLKYPRFPHRPQIVESLPLQTFEGVGVSLGTLGHRAPN